MLTTIKTFPQGKIQNPKKSPQAGIPHPHPGLNTSTGYFTSMKNTQNQNNTFVKLPLIPITFGQHTASKNSQNIIVINTRHAKKYLSLVIHACMLYNYPLRGWTHFRIAGKIPQCHDQSPKWQPFGRFEILIGGDHLWQGGDSVQRRNWR